MARQPKAALFTVTEKAATQIKAILAQREKPAYGIRICVKTRGCSGLSYALEYADAPSPHEEMVETAGIKLLIDPKAIMFVVGTTMDFTQEKMGEGFVFSNPNEKGRCGCGESFHV